MSTPDKRLYERRILRANAVVALSPSQFIKVRTTDICMGGVSIIADMNLKSGTSLAIQIPLPLTPNVVNIETDAEVTHSILANDVGGFKVGLRFKNLDNKSNSSLSQYLK